MCFPSGISQGKPWLIRGHSILYPSVFCLKKTVQSPCGIHFLDSQLAMDKHRHSGWTAEFRTCLGFPVSPPETKHAQKLWLPWQGSPCFKPEVVHTAFCMYSFHEKVPPLSICQPHCGHLEHENSGARLHPLLLSASSGLSLFLPM